VLLCGALFEGEAIWVLQPAGQHVDNLVHRADVNVTRVLILIVDVLHHLQWIQGISHSRYRQQLTSIIKAQACVIAHSLRSPPGVVVMYTQHTHTNIKKYEKQTNECQAVSQSRKW
jgi:hypothetical protein